MDDSYQNLKDFVKEQIARRVKALNDSSDNLQKILDIWARTGFWELSNLDDLCVHFASGSLNSITEWEMRAIHHESDTIYIPKIDLQYEPLIPESMFDKHMYLADCMQHRREVLIKMMHFQNLVALQYGTMCIDSESTVLSLATLFQFRDVTAIDSYEQFMLNNTRVFSPFLPYAGEFDCTLDCQTSGLYSVFKVLCGLHLCSIPPQSIANDPCPTLQAHLAKRGFVMVLIQPPYELGQPCLGYSFVEFLADNPHAIVDKQSVCHFHAPLHTAVIIRMRLTQNDANRKSRMTCRSDVETVKGNENFKDENPGLVDPGNRDLVGDNIYEVLSGGQKSVVKLADGSEYALAYALSERLDEIISSRTASEAGTALENSSDGSVVSEIIAKNEQDFADVAGVADVSNIAKTTGSQNVDEWKTPKHPAAAKTISPTRLRESLSKIVITGKDEKINTNKEGPSKENGDSVAHHPTPIMSKTSPLMTVKSKEENISKKNKKILNPANLTNILKMPVEKSNPVASIEDLEKEYEVFCQKYKPVLLSNAMKSAKKVVEWLISVYDSESKMQAVDALNTMRNRTLKSWETIFMLFVETKRETRGVLDYVKLVLDKNC